MPRPISYAVFCLKKKKRQTDNSKYDKHVGTQWRTIQVASVATYCVYRVHSHSIPVSCTHFTYPMFSFFFFFNDTATTEIYTLSLHDALPISRKAAWSI